MESKTNANNAEPCVTTVMDLMIVPLALVKISDTTDFALPLVKTLPMRHIRLQRTLFLREMMMISTSSLIGFVFFARFPNVKHVMDQTANVIHVPEDSVCSETRVLETVHLEPSETEKTVLNVTTDVMFAMILTHAPNVLEVTSSTKENVSKSAQEELY
jgi:hypothetical protein